MENKQTAVEYLTNELYSYLAEEELSLTIWDEISEKVTKAKSMEKQQTMDAFMSGEHQQGFENEAEQYYNETYGKENKL
jgi:ethanolamine utilization cobalamin adenosyltransferase